jgi:hypothetical protein
VATDARQHLTGRPGRRSGTAAAAPVHAGAPLTVDEVASALGWPPGRVEVALGDAERYPDITDPIAVRGVAFGAYTIAARPDRLTATQRDALGRLPRRRRVTVDQEGTGQASAT